jgi:hypothetical protein
MIFVQPMGDFGMPISIRNIGPIRWIGTVMSKVAPVI